MCWLCLLGQISPGSADSPELLFINMLTVKCYWESRISAFIYFFSFLWVSAFKHRTSCCWLIHDILGFLITCKICTVSTNLSGCMFVYSLSTNTSIKSLLNAFLGGILFTISRARGFEPDESFFVVAGFLFLFLCSPGCWTQRSACLCLSDGIKGV